VQALHAQERSPAARGGIVDRVNARSSIRLLACGCGILATVAGCAAASPPPASAAAPASPPPAPPAPPVCAGASTGTLTAYWDSDDLYVRELPAAHVTFGVTGMSYWASLSSMPPGTSFVLGDRTVVTDDRVEVDIAKVLADEAPTELAKRSKLDPHLTFELRVPGFAPLRVAAPPENASHDVESALAEALNHPVRFPGEPATAAPGTAHSLLYTSDAEVFGPAQTLRDVDWVAVDEDLLPRKGPTCRLHADKDGGPPEKVELHLVDKEVTVVERRTSRVVAHQKFVAPSDCPDRGSGPTQDVSPDDGVITRWLRAQVTPRS
jgi:hypothetical protein